MRDIYDYIEVFRGVIAHNDADQIVARLEAYKWQEHKWGEKADDPGGGISYKDDVTHNHDTEFSEAPVETSEKAIIKAAINEALTRYAQKWPLSNPTAYSPVSMHKYDANTMMKPHVDHIHTFFDGKIRGIPILSIVGLLNGPDEFQGGQFMFNDEKDPKLEKGDVLIFPSNFIYKHKVQLVTSGTRYSYVTWAF